MAVVYQEILHPCHAGCILLVFGGEMREMLVAVACAGEAAADPRMAKVQDSSYIRLGWWAYFKEWAANMSVS